MWVGPKLLLCSSPYPLVQPMWQVLSCTDWQLMTLTLPKYKFSHWGDTACCFGITLVNVTQSFILF